jgi:hypothetical protein
MLAAAEREGDAGWRSSALSFRAGNRMVLGDGDLTEYDIDAVLRDLAAAEATLADGIADLCLASNAHVGIGVVYHRLRLHELAEPRYAAGYELGCRYGDPDLPAICQVNLAELHLQWALELYRIGDVEAVGDLPGRGQDAVRPVGFPQPSQGWRGARGRR